MESSVLSWPPCRLEVEVNTAAGFPASEREHIFEEFYQLGNPERDRSRGLGLGLAIVKSVIEQHGGALDFESPWPVGAAGGSQFRFTLPAVSESIETDPQAAP